MQDATTVTNDGYHVSYESGWGIDGVNLHVRYCGYHYVTRSFPTQADAKQFAFDKGYIKIFHGERKMK